MTRYAFLIDQDTCIGCHACTVACKSEHDVPIGVNRTWVKYIERGEFPNTRRFFSVQRCNHCDDAPCVTICPTRALFRRPDGIVDFDDSRCIGCKSCMHACPYDAIYINPDTQTAHKCNFCAHRVEVGLEPSCVVVCPTQSIIAGDLHDPGSRLAVTLARHDTRVRAPEQGTRPHVFYKGADQAALDPLRTRIAADGMIWADTTPDHPTLPVDPPGADSQVIARTAYTTPHPTPWGTKVSAYLVTKAISGGALVVGALAALGRWADQRSVIGIGAPLLALVFAAVTGALLIADLRQPRRFHYLFTRPQWGSWLVRGAVILLAHGALAALWLLGGLTDAPGLIRAVAIPAAVIGAATAGYTAWLFGQCEGRDLWQSPLLLPVLVAQAVAAGAGALGIVAALAGAAGSVPGGLVELLGWCLFAGAAAQAVLVAVELTSHGTVSTAVAARALVAGPFRSRFRLGVAVGMVAAGALGLLVALTPAEATSPSATGAIGVLVALTPAEATSSAVSAATSAGAGTLVALALGGLCAIAGLFFYEDGFVRAGQSVPLS